MKKRTDEEIQAILDQGGGTDPYGWERDDLMDLHAYRLIDAVLAEEPGFSLPPDFADMMANRLMPSAVAPAERFVFGALLVGFLLLGAVVAAGVLPLIVGGAGRIAAAVSEHGRPDVLLAIAVMLAAAALLDRLLSMAWRSMARAHRSR